MLLPISPLRAATLGLAALALLAPVAHGHALPGRTTSERELRRVETTVLGAAHAAEHAAQRSAARRAPRAVRPAPRARRASVLPAHEVGAWSAPRPIRHAGADSGAFGIHAALLPTGKVMWFSYPSKPDRPDAGRGVAVLWNPSTGGFEDVPPPEDPRTGKPLNIWCGGQSLLSDGRLLVTGGNLAFRDTSRAPGEPGSDYAGLEVVLTFDPFEWERSHDPGRAWQRHEDMEHGRWYPSQMLMPDGRTLILQGRDESGIEAQGANENDDIEVFDPGRPGDEIEKVGEVPRHLMGDIYPHAFWMPSGRGLVAGPERANSWFLTGPRLVLQNGPDPALMRIWGTAVLMPLGAGSHAGEVMQIGGSPDRRTSTRTTERFRESERAWRPGESLSVARSHHNTVLLPDESMVTIGGGVGDDVARARQWTADEEHKQIELYDPRSERWRLGPAQRENRAYHSTALLLPDGSVVSAGDDYNGGTTSDSYEIYRPSYLFRDGRPTLSSAPPAATYGSSPEVASPDDDVDRAVLVAPGTTTHAVDMHQRVVRLPVARTGDGYRVTMPATPHVAPPGRYMLFLVDREGVPSEAEWVQLGHAGQVRADPEPAPAPGSPAPEPAPAPGSPAPEPAPEGAPVPAPASPQGPVPPAASPRADGPAPSAGPRRSRAERDAPRVTVRLPAPTRLALARSGRLPVRVGLSEAGRVRLVPRVGSRRMSVAGPARTVVFRRGGVRTITVLLAREARERLRRDRHARFELVLSARDGDGYRREQRVSVHLR